MHNKVVTRDTFTQPRPEKTLGTRLTFTVVNDPFTSGNWRVKYDRMLPRYIYQGKYPCLRQKEEETAHDI